MEVVFQAAIVNAILSNCASRANFVDATAIAKTRTNELLAMLSPAARINAEPFVQAELDATD